MCEADTVTQPDLLEEIRAAEPRLRSYIRETPLERSAALGRRARCDVLLKLENLQRTGSFKARGALNKLLSLSDGQRRAGVVTASTGNHGAAMAWAMREVGVEGRILVPEGAAESKLAAIRRLGGELGFHGRDGAETELFARRLAESEGMTYVSPYNDAAVVGGQGTVGVELLRQSPEPPEVVLVSVGGGGLIAGISTWLEAQPAEVAVFGCQPEASAVMSSSVAAGAILDLPSAPTLSDGTAGGVEPESLTFAPCRDLVDRWILVSEGEIAAAMRSFIERRKMPIEGSAGVALAAFEKERARWRGLRVAIVICGGNVDPAVLDRVMTGTC